MSSNLEKKIKALNLRDAQKNKEIATLRDQIKTLSANQQNFVQALQQWELMNKSQAKIVHSMAIAVNVMMDKKLITPQELEAKQKKMQADHEEIKRAQRVAQEAKVTPEFPAQVLESGATLKASSADVLTKEVVAEAKVTLSPGVTDDLPVEALEADARLTICSTKTETPKPETQNA